MQVDTSVAEADVGKLQPGMDGDVHRRRVPGETFKGTIRQIRNAPQTLQNVVTYDAVIDVDNPDLELQPGHDRERHLRLRRARRRAARSRTRRCASGRRRSCAASAGGGRRAAAGPAAAKRQARGGGGAAAAAPAAAAAGGGTARGERPTGGRVWVLRGDKPTPVRVRGRRLRRHQDRGRRRRAARGRPRGHRRRVAERRRQAPAAAAAAAFRRMF